MAPRVGARGEQGRGSGNKTTQEQVAGVEGQDGAGAGGEWKEDEDGERDGEAWSRRSASPAEFTGGPSLDDGQLDIGQHGAATDDAADLDSNRLFLALQSAISGRVALSGRKRQSFRLQLDDSAVIGALAAGPSPIEDMIDGEVDERDARDQDQEETDDKQEDALHDDPPESSNENSAQAHHHAGASSQDRGSSSRQSSQDASGKLPAIRSPLDSRGEAPEPVPHSPYLSPTQTPRPAAHSAIEMHRLRLRSHTATGASPSSPLIRGRWMAALGRVPALRLEAPAAAGSGSTAPPRSVSGGTGSVVGVDGRPGSRTGGRLTPSGLQGPGRSVSASLAERGRGAGHREAADDAVMAAVVKVSVANADDDWKQRDGSTRAPAEPEEGEGDGGNVPDGAKASTAEDAPAGGSQGGPGSTAATHGRSSARP